MMTVDETTTINKSSSEALVRYGIRGTIVAVVGNPALMAKSIMPNARTSYY